MYDRQTILVPFVREEARHYTQISRFNFPKTITRQTGTSIKTPVNLANLPAIVCQTEKETMITAFTQDNNYLSSWPKTVV